MSSLLALVIVGQSCIAQQMAYQPVQHQAQAYNQSYVEKTIFVAVEPQEAQAYYGGLVASQQRQAERQAERQAQAQQVQTATDAKLDQLARLVLDLQKRLETQSSEPVLPSHPGQQAAPLPSPPSVPSEAVSPPPTISQAATRRASDSPANRTGLALLSQKCGACHTGSAQAGGGIGLFAVDGRFLPGDQENLDRIEAAITTGRMPKRAKQPMSLREYITIRDYLNGQTNGVALNFDPRKKLR